MEFFTSDTHFFHRNIINHCNRPFADVDEMNAELIRRWNERVSPADTVYHVGDVSFKGTGATKEIISQLNGYKILIRGNHDSGEQKMLNIGFAEVYDDYVLMRDTVEKPTAENGETVLLWLAHVPVNNSHDSRPLKRPDMDEVLFNQIEMGYDYIPLCGHVHTAWKSFEGCINVGCDVWDYRPITLNEILEYRHSLHVERLSS